MRILIVSSVFHPSIGGIETSSLMFANGMRARGHDVTVVTHTPSDGGGFAFPVVRRPNAWVLFDLVRRADVVWHNQISLRALWPLFLVPRPLIVTHQTWLGRDGWYGRGRGALRRLCCRRGTNVYISRPLADDVRLPGAIVPNGYDDAVFRPRPDTERTRDVVFLGRLIRDKGADLVIEAIALLKADLPMTATIIGSGMERDALQAQAATAGVADRIVFTGPLQGEALARELNRHRVIAVTSRFAEPFGIVALEGMACGCVPIAARVGGLPEAVASCGPLIPPDDAIGLAQALKTLMSNPDVLAGYRSRAAARLAKVTSSSVVGAYESVMRGLAPVAAGRTP